MTSSSEAQSPQLSVIVPAFNEEARIATALSRIAAYVSTLPFPCEVIVVDDGSGEPGRRATNAAVAELPEGLGRVIRHEYNRGKGAAVRTGALAARGEWVAFIDADLASPPEDLTGLLQAMERGADVAIGVRRQADGSDMRNRRSLPRRLAGQAYAQAMRLLLLPDIDDSQCPLKAFRRSAAQRLFVLQQIETWAFDAELLFLARKLRMHAVQVPVSWHAVAGSHLRLEPRMARELLNLLRIRWAHRNVHPDA
jgi:glycosyltransferase involved in cell wall biosynthesis